MTSLCPICHNSSNNSMFTATERLMGTRAVFNYSQCSNCGTVFLNEEIKDFSIYYPKIYHQKPGSGLNSFKRRALRQVCSYNFWNKGLIGQVISYVFQKIHGYRAELNITWVGKAYRHILAQNPSVKQADISILDVGCGGGVLLSQLQDNGFTQLLGVEPFLGDYTGPVAIKKQQINEFLADTSNHGKFDIVILSHVLEHVYNHEIVVQNLMKLLTKKGVLIISMPFIGGLFNKFKENRFSLDAPRHVIIHSIPGFESMLQKIGIQIIDTLYEQTYREIAMSEMYEYDIGFLEEKKLRMLEYNKKKHIKIANALNKIKSGGSCVTYLLCNK